MEFDFDKRVRFASTVYVEGVNAEVPDRLTGIDKDGVRTSFAANAVEAGNAVLLYEIENDFGVFDDEWYAADEEFGEEIKASCAAYAVFAEEDNREGYAYIIDAAADLAFVNRDGVTEQMPIADFRAAAWRVDAAGTPVIAFAANLEAQYKTCKDLGLASHVVEIDDMFERLKQSDLAGDQMRAFWHDLGKQPGDHVTFEEIYERVYLENRTPLHERFELNEKTGVEWKRTIDNSLFQDPRIRQAMTFFLKDRIGDFPVEQIAYVGFENLEAADTALSAIFENRKVTEPFDGSTIMPGYKTTNVLEFDANGLTVIAFSDMGGLGYAYAYPTRRALNLLPAPEATETLKV